MRPENCSRRCHGIAPAPKIHATRFQCKKICLDPTCATKQHTSSPHFLKTWVATGCEAHCHGVLSPHLFVFRPCHDSARSWPGPKTEGEYCPTAQPSGVLRLAFGPRMPSSGPQPSLSAAAVGKSLAPPVDVKSREADLSPTPCLCIVPQYLLCPNTSS